MFTRITKFQRLDYMQQGFIHLGYSSGVAEMLSTKSHEQLCRELDNLIKSLEITLFTSNTLPSFDRTIVKHTSREMTDNKGGVYARRGKSYLYKNVLMHLHDNGLTVSIMLVKI